MMLKLKAASAALAALCLGGTASAELVTFQTYNGSYGLSTDGWGGSDGEGVISAEVPDGATITAAYLYTATQNFGGALSTVEFDGVMVSYDATFPNATACCTLSSHRADVTSIVASAAALGGGILDFDIMENANNSAIDGHALVVVYSDPSLPESTVAILNGFADVTGDTTSLNFAEPLDTTDEDFFAEMRLGINFSCCNQQSTVSVNGSLLSESAGNLDDGEVQTNGSLITVGGFDDDFSPVLPNYAEDTERYDLTTFIEEGDTSIVVETVNASEDDNIFLAAFYLSGRAGVNTPPPPPGPETPEVPLPAAGYLFLTALGGMIGLRRRRS